MSRAKRNKRKQKETMNRHTSTLINKLTSFFNFLERQPKPSDEEVRSTFISYNQSWISYCVANHLNPRASLLFNQEVARAWRSRYAQTQPPMTENATQK